MGWILGPVYLSLFFDTSHHLLKCSFITLIKVLWFLKKYKTSTFPFRVLARCFVVFLVGSVEMRKVVRPQHSKLVFGA